ncbi:MAG: ATP-dependent DNA helicase [Candidatus Methanomethylophilaceae archaeon]|nr:ATP-dependent DNA helicase [Candidatus Methanomethylophilaceae archaeon]
MGIFPYEPRAGQRELIGFIDRTVREGRCAVVEAGTGTGKTVSSLCGVLQFARDRGMKVLYLTRTKSQQKQVIREAAALRCDTLCVGVQGRSASSCPLMRDDPDLASGTPDEISRLCSEYKRRDDGGCHCKFYERIESVDIGDWIRAIHDGHLGPEEFSRMCEDAGLCPYEMVKYALPHANIIAVPYPFVFMPHVLDRFIEWIGVPLDHTVMVVDEAHNLPDYLRDVQTYEYSRAAMALTEREAREHGDPEVHEGITVSDVAAVLMEVLAFAEREYLIDEDGMLPPYMLQDELMDRLGVTTVALSRICKAMEEIGDGIAERRKQRRKLPRSYILSMSRFIQFWLDSDDDMYVRLVVGGDNPKFQSYCMDPRGASDPINRCFSSVHMSGTLEPLDAYCEELGIDRPAKLSLGGIFPPENMVRLYTDEVSMKYEERFVEENYERLFGMLVDTVNSVAVNTAVFFPSYQFMDRMVDDGLVSALGRDVYYERRGMPQSELMEVFDTFRSSEGSVLFCITGGRISEGLDFPDKSLELAVIVGIPYPKPTARLRALKRYYDIRLGDGVLFTTVIPTARRMRQAMGRVIRSETDRGVAVVLDRRLSGLPMMDAILCRDIPVAVRAFFESGPGQQL